MIYFKTLFILTVSLSYSDQISIKTYGPRIDKNQFYQYQYDSNYMLIESDLKCDSKEATAAKWWWFDDVKMYWYCKIWEC